MAARRMEPFQQAMAGNSGNTAPTAAGQAASCMLKRGAAGRAVSVSCSSWVSSYGMRRLTCHPCSSRSRSPPPAQDRWSGQRRTPAPGPRQARGQTNARRSAVLPGSVCYVAAATRKRWLLPRSMWHVRMLMGGPLKLLRDTCMPYCDDIIHQWYVQMEYAILTFVDQGKPRCVRCRAADCKAHEWHAVTVYAP